MKILLAILATAVCAAIGVLAAGYFKYCGGAHNLVC